jgi:hypothetical protein
MAVDIDAIVREVAGTTEESNVRVIRGEAAQTKRKSGK